MKDALFFIVASIYLIAILLLTSCESLHNAQEKSAVVALTTGPIEYVWACLGLWNDGEQTKKSRP